MIIAIDFDGTCVDHCYPVIGKNNPLAVETLKDLIKLGHKLILWTMRSDKELQDAVTWFKNNDIVLYGIQSNPEQYTWTTSKKCYAQLYIDDAAFGAPLIKFELFNRPCLDWSKVREYFKLL